MDIDLDIDLGKEDITLIRDGKEYKNWTYKVGGNNGE